jgi:hypothetical protein
MARSIVEDLNWLAKLKLSALGSTPTHSEFLIQTAFPAPPRRDRPTRLQRLRASENIEGANKTAMKGGLMEGLATMLNITMWHKL